MVSHELKTPLVPITGYCEMLLESGLIGELNADQTEFIKKIQSNSYHLKNLTDKILQAQRLDMQKQSWDIQTFNIKEFMNDIHLGHKGMMVEKNIEFINNSPNEFKVESDRNNLKEVFVNIIQNAVDFVPANTGRIEINSKQSGDDILFSVKDNGTGIPKEKLEHIFKKFYQADTSNTRTHGGTGLGLSICNGIIDGLGGKIWVESKVGLGSTFFFSITKKFSEKQ